jgi:uncharacterized protein Usg
MDLFNNNKNLIWKYLDFVKKKKMLFKILGFWKIRKKDLLKNIKMCKRKSKILPRNWSEASKKRILF